MAILVNNSTNASISILQRTNELFGITQKRVASGKRVFTAADDTTRYKASETLLGRSKQLSDINNNISLGLSTLQTTDQTLNNMIGLVESAIDLVSSALRTGSIGERSTTTTASMDSSTIVAGVTIGSTLSISSDGGKNFTYVFNSTTTTWGEVTNALNAANIGVQAKFIPSTVAGQTNLHFYASNNKDFTFDPVTDQAVMDDLVGFSSPSGQIFTPNNLFANGLAAPGAGESGFSITYGGILVGNVGGGVTGATVIAAGSNLTFEDGQGGFRSLAYGAATTVAQVISDINAMGSGIKAELVNQTAGAGGPLQFRLRNQNGGNMKIIAASIDFDTGGSLGLNGISTGYAAPLSTNNGLRLVYGQQYDAIIENLDEMVANNAVPKGRNLLLGENISLMLNEFDGSPLKLSGVLVSATGLLTMIQPGSSWINEQNIQTSASQSQQALKELRSLQAQFATFNNYIKTRYDLNRAYQGDTRTLGDDLVAADVSEESANLVALQTQQQFAVQALSIGNQNEQSLLRLLG